MKTTLERLAENGWTNTFMTIADFKIFEKKIGNSTYRLVIDKRTSEIANRYKIKFPDVATALTLAEYQA